MTREEALQLREAVGAALGALPQVERKTRSAFYRLIDALKESSDVVIFPAHATVSTSQAAELLGVSRMTVVRLIDRGEIRADVVNVHRRISVAELERYQADVVSRKREAMAELAADITEDAPADRVVATR